MRHHRAILATFLALLVLAGTAEMAAAEELRVRRLSEEYGFSNVSGLYAGLPFEARRVQLGGGKSGRILREVETKTAPGRLPLRNLRLAQVSYTNAAGKTERGLLVRSGNKTYLVDLLHVDTLKVKPTTKSISKFASKLGKAGVTMWQGRRSRVVAPLAVRKTAKKDKAARAYSDYGIALRTPKTSRIAGRQAEISSLAQKLKLRTSNNVLLTGTEGAGRGGVVEGLLEAIGRGEHPELKKRPIVKLNMIELGSPRGKAFEKRLKRFLDGAAQKKAIVVVEDIDRIADSKYGAYLLEHPDVQFIGTTSKLKALRGFRRVKVKPLAGTSLRGVGENFRDSVERGGKVRVSDDAIRGAETLAQKYLPGEGSTGAVRELLDAAAADVAERARRAPDLKRRAAEVRAEVDTLREQVTARERSRDQARERGSRRDVRRINRDLRQLRKDLALAEDRARDAEVRAQRADVVGWDDVARAVKERTGMPVLASKNDVDRVVFLEENLKAQMRADGSLEGDIVGQHRAVRVIHEAVQGAYAGLNKPGQPIGSFLFTGPPGVGKTETGKALAKHLFGDPGAAVIENVAGKSQSAIRRSLANQIRKRPFSVLVFDEVAKNPAAQEMLLGIIGDGEMDDGKGGKVRFDNTIIIVNSNANKQSDGSYLLQKHDGNQHRVFSPEFVSRLHHVEFKKLDETFVDEKVEARTARRRQRKRDAGRRADITGGARGRQSKDMTALEALVGKEISRVRDVLRTDKLGLDLHVTRRAQQHLEDIVRTSADGRASLRHVQQELVAPIALWKNAGAFAEGDSLRIGYERGKLVLKAKSRGEANFGARYKKRAGRHIENRALSRVRDAHHRLDQLESAARRGSADAVRDAKIKHLRNELPKTKQRALRRANRVGKRMGIGRRSMRGRR